MDYALSSIIGKRDNQEDFGIIIDTKSSKGVLAVISDGMGGQVAGEVASSSAVRGFVESFSSNNSKNLPLKFNVALNKANRTLVNSIAKNPKLHGMGATLIAAQIDQHQISWVSVGDSIIYLYRDKKLNRLNDDHSMMPVLQDSVRRGKITQEEARDHPHRNALRSALTGDEIPIVDLREEPFQLKKNDLLILATDGVLTLSVTEICQVLDRCNEHSAKVTADYILNAVMQKNKPRQDNTLVEVIKVTGGGRSFFKWTDIAIATSIFVIVLVFGSVVLENKNSLFKAIGYNTSQQDISSIPESSQQKSTLISIENTPPQHEVKGSEPPIGDEPRVKQESQRNEPSVKITKPSVIDKKSGSIKSSQTDESQVNPKNNHSNSIGNGISSSADIVAEPTKGNTNVEALEILPTTNRIQATPKDGERTNLLLDSNNIISN
jgi:serine/threonine protein phosphatase PrpC